jgi:hypothetical protein
MLYTAFTVYEAALERPKKDIDRKPKYMDRNFQRTRRRLFISLDNHDPESDRAIFRKYILMVLALRGKQIEPISQLFHTDRSASPGSDVKPIDKKIDRFLEQAYSKTRLSDPELVKKYFSKSIADLKKLNDPFMDLAISLYPLFKELDEVKKERKGLLDELSARLIKVKNQWLGSDFIPDANRTFRLTFGHIRGYSPADAVCYGPLTALKGVIEKNTGKHPFQVPEKIIRLYKTGNLGQFRHPELNDVPVCILYDTDTTGGNSGSPIMNSRGELIGLNFDRTFEATINDFAWNQSYSRSIGVDIRYILWIMKRYSNCDHLLKEMGVFSENEKQKPG